VYNNNVQSRNDGDKVASGTPIRKASVRHFDLWIVIAIHCDPPQVAVATVAIPCVAVGDGISRCAVPNPLCGDTHPQTRGSARRFQFWATVLVLDGFAKTSASLLETMAGTTGLEPAISAVTAWKNTDGTRSHWKYAIDNVIAYRGVYRGIERRKIAIEMHG
jgi:hypothetical protein